MGLSKNNKITQSHSMKAVAESDSFFLARSRSACVVFIMDGNAKYWHCRIYSSHDHCRLLFILQLESVLPSVVAPRAHLAEYNAMNDTCDRL